MPRIDPPPVDLQAVAIAFDLPGPLRIEDFHQGASGAWRVLDAGSDRHYSLKIQPRNAPQHQIDQLAVSGELERRAWEAALPIVPPLVPISPAIGLTALIGDHYVWMHEWIEVNPPNLSDTQMQQWIGQTLAALHSLMPVGRDQEADLRHAYGLHPRGDWETWFQEAEDRKLNWATSRDQALDMVDQISTLARAALDLPLDRCVTQRDFTPVNVIHGSGSKGPLLADFGYAGVDIPWLEIVAASSRFPGSGAIEAYLNAGGSPGPVTIEALAGIIGPALNWLAFQMWVSLCHRGGSIQWQAEATSRIEPLLLNLRTELADLEQLRGRIFG